MKEPFFFLLRCHNCGQFCYCFLAISHALLPVADLAIQVRQAGLKFAHMAGIEQDGADDKHEHSQDDDAADYLRREQVFETHRTSLDKQRDVISIINQ